MFIGPRGLGGRLRPDRLSQQPAGRPHPRPGGGALLITGFTDESTATVDVRRVQLDGAPARVAYRSNAARSSSVSSGRHRSGSLP